MSSSSSSEKDGLRAQIDDLEPQLGQLVDADARDLVQAKLEELRQRLKEVEPTPTPA